MPPIRAYLLIAVLGLRGAAAVEATGPAGSAPVAFLYHEHNDGRVVAVVDAWVSAVGSPAVLNVRIASRDPRIVPPPGWQHLAGGNATTAIEIERLHARGELALVRRVAGVWQAEPTQARPGLRAPWPEHQAGDSHISAEAPSARAYLHDLSLQAPLPSGGPDQQEWGVLARGALRLVLRVRSGGGTAQVLAIDDPRLPTSAAETAP